MNFRFFPTLLVACGIAALAWFTGGFFSSTNVCTDCGSIQDVRRVMWIPIAEVHETPLSLYLKSIRHASPHSHDWMFVGGHGGPISCVLGVGRQIAQSTSRHDIVESLETIRNNRGDAEADQWINRIFDRKKTTGACFALCSLSQDRGSFEYGYAMVEKEYRAWQKSLSP